jgi:hypothetical protein
MSAIQAPDRDRQDAERECCDRESCQESERGVECHVPVVDVTVFAVETPGRKREECAQQAADNERPNQALTFRRSQIEHLGSLPESSRWRPSACGRQRALNP